jgi:hypothetical protein
MSLPSLTIVTWVLSDYAMLPVAVRVRALLDSMLDTSWLGINLVGQGRGGTEATAQAHAAQRRGREG